MAVGYSANPDPAEAGSDAAGSALAMGSPRLLMVFCSDSYEPEPLVGAINAASGGVALIGCSTSGAMTNAGAGDGGVAIAALGGEGFRASTSAGTDISRDPRGAGAAAAADAEQLGDEAHRALVLLADGRAADLSEVVRGVNSVAGTGIPLAGGSAGDGVRKQGAFQLHGGEVLRGAAVGAAVASDAPIGLGYSHGWTAGGEPILITRSEGNRVLEIDDAPALDSYLDYLDAPDDVRVDAEAFSTWAAVRPLGLGRRRTGEQPARYVDAADFDERALICTGDVPQGGLAWFMRGDSSSVLRSTKDACEAAIEDAGTGAGGLGLIAFNCVGRRGVLGDEGIAAEIELLNETAEAPVAGLYTHGEIARRRGVNAVHNQTLAALAFA